MIAAAGAQVDSGGMRLVLGPASGFVEGGRRQGVVCAVVKKRRATKREKSSERRS